MLEHTETRRYDIDWLRIACIIMLFPFHTARVFDVWDPFYVKSDELSWTLSWMIGIIGYWFMPLLFWLAGSASWYALKKRSSSQYVRERYSRLFIPFLFGLLLIVPPQGYIALLHHSGVNNGYWQFLKHFFTDFSDSSGYFGTFTPAHLWFILYLFVLSLIALPIFLTIKAAETTMRSKWNRTFSRPLPFISLSVLLLVTQALPAPGGQNPFLFLFIFIIGFIVASDHRYQLLFNAIRFKAILAIAILVPIHLVMLNSSFNRSAFSTVDILITFIHPLIMWLSLIAILGYGNKWLNKPQRVLTYLNEAAFPIYIVHQTILVIISYFIIQLNWSMPVAFICIMLLSLAGSFLLYEYVIKRIRITRWIFGLSPKMS